MFGAPFSAVAFSATLDAPTIHVDAVAIGAVWVDGVSNAYLYDPITYLSVDAVSVIWSDSRTTAIALQMPALSTEDSSTKYVLIQNVSRQHVFLEYTDTLYRKMSTLLPAYGYLKLTQTSQITVQMLTLAQVGTLMIVYNGRLIKDRRDILAAISRSASSRQFIDVDP